MDMSYVSDIISGREIAHATHFCLYPRLDHKSDYRQKLPPREVQRAIQKSREIANLDLDITPHSLRHAFATDCAKNGPIFMVQRLLGHKNIDSTTIYLHASQADYEKMVAR